MRTIILLIVAFVGGASASEQSAETPEYYFDCDAAAAHKSSWERTVSAQPFVLTGTVALLEARDDPKWLPTISIRVLGQNDTPGVGLIVARQLAEPHTFNVVLLDDITPKERVSVGEINDFSTPVPFRVEVSKLGDVTLSIGPLIATTRITQFPLKRISLACSTGEFRFARVTVREHEELSPNNRIERTREE